MVPVLLAALLLLPAPRAAAQEGASALDPLGTSFTQLRLAGALGWWPAGAAPIQAPPGAGQEEPERALAGAFAAGRAVRTGRNLTPSRQVLDGRDDR